MTLDKHIVGYLGVPGSYTYQATEDMFEEAKLVGFSSIFEIIESAEKGEITHGVVPVENSIAGRVAELYQVLDIIDLSIVAEHFVEISHCLAVPKKSSGEYDLAEIDSVQSHKQALMQCRKWLAKNLPDAAQISLSDTATSAKTLSEEGDSSKAAICSLRAAEIYGLHVMESSIQDNVQNFTRFHVLGRESVSSEDIGEAAITTVIFQVNHDPGALLKALNAVAMHNVNIIKLETYMVSGLRTAPTFYVDIAINRFSKAGEKALSDLVDNTTFLKVIGSYNASPLRGSIAGFLTV